MNKLIILIGLIALLFGLSLFAQTNRVEYVTATIYHAVPEQTDDTPFQTASGKFIDWTNPYGHRWMAVSRDLEYSGFAFGTKVLVEGAGDLDGVWTVQDRMNERWMKRIDFLVNEDRKLGKWYGVKITIIR